jgi:DnaJ-class molecular chaperone
MDLYEILGISHLALTANDIDIKKAYRKLALIYHPDKKTGDVEKFKQINIAYEILIDPEKRSKYDNMSKSNKVKLYDMFNSIIPTQYEPIINNIINIFYEDKKDLQKDLNNLEFSLIKNKILSKINDFKNISNKTNIYGEINVPLKEVYCRTYRKLDVKRVRNDMAEIIRFNIPIIDNTYILNGEGDIIDDITGNLIITINHIEDPIFNKLNNSDLIINKNISFYDYINGFSFELELLDNQKININFDKINGLLQKITGYGLYYNYTDEKRGDLFIKYHIINTSSLDITGLFNLFGTII